MADKSYAVVDIGSNSLRLLKGRRDAAGSWNFEKKLLETTRLGKELDRTGRLDAEGIERSLAVMARWQLLLRDAAVYAIATSAVREASNGFSFMAEIRRRFGWLARIVSGQEEAALSFCGAASALPVHGTVAVIDIGGGSTEVAFGTEGAICWSHSYPMGAVRFALGDIVPASKIAELEQHCEALWLPMDVPETLLGVGGTLTSVAAMDQELSVYDSERIQGYVISEAGLSRHIARIQAMSAGERRQVPGLQPRRSDIILSGMSIARSFLRHYGISCIRVSERDLLEGFFWKCL